MLMQMRPVTCLGSALLAAVAMMMAAVVSGVLIHRHVIRDLFLAERPGGRLPGVRDRHALSSTWSIPFAFLLAFTGSFFSFAGTIGLPIVVVEDVLKALERLGSGGGGAPAPPVRPCPA